MIQIVVNMRGRREVQQYLKPSVKRGGGSVMAWSCVVCCVGDLVEIHEIMNIENYHLILNHHAIIYRKQRLNFSMAMIPDTLPMQ